MKAARVQTEPSGSRHLAGSLIRNIHRGLQEVSAEPLQSPQHSLPQDLAGG